MYKLWDKTPLFDLNLAPEQKEPSIKPFLIENSPNKSCIIVCPGGGYYIKADHEGDPIAMALNKAGVNAFVLDYRVIPYRQPCPLLDLLRAIRYVRYHAEKFNIDPDKIGVLGFSAGGHLSSSASVHYDYPIDILDEIDKVSARPDFSVLCYAVINMAGDFGHPGSSEALCGKDASEELKNYYSSEKNVTKDTPPAFLWHTSEDDGVPVQNAYEYANALAKFKIPAEVHVFPKGRHGLGLAPEEPHVAQWMELLEKWLRVSGF